MIVPSQESLNLVKSISDNMIRNTFHHHYHILYDIAKLYPKDYQVQYVEIGAFAGGSACLMLQHPNIKVISIDLGTPIEPQIVAQNVEKFNTQNHFYKYIQGNSSLLSTKTQLVQHISEIDILFIDGDHSYQGVINDFNLYEDLVKDGGFIIFDDYNDLQHSPQVKPAVDDLIPKISDRYNIIGVFENKLGAHPSILLSGNDFVIQKKDRIFKQK